MTVLGNRALIPTWFVAVGLAGLFSPPPTLAMGGVLFVTAVVVVPSLMVIAAMWERSTMPWSHRLQQTWHMARAARAARLLVNAGDARDLARLDSDKG